MVGALDFINYGNLRALLHAIKQTIFAVLLIIDKTITFCSINSHDMFILTILVSVKIEI